MASRAAITCRNPRPPSIAPPYNMKKVSLSTLRPTQATHGRREVEEKTREYRSLSGHDLEMAIAEKAIPIVLGPGQIPFAIDHHHVAAALCQAGIHHAPCVLVRDLSSLSETQFWLTLENHRWVHPYDNKGRRIAFDSLPQHILDVANDEYRSLAAFVRDAGGYERTTVPLAEFRWADLFRATLAWPENDADFERLLKKALQVAGSALAVGLPGYTGRKRGKPE